MGAFVIVGQGKSLPVCKMLSTSFDTDHHASSFIQFEYDSEIPKKVGHSGSYLNDQRVCVPKQRAIIVYGGAWPLDLVMDVLVYLFAYVYLYLCCCPTYRLKSSRVSATTTTLDYLDLRRSLGGVGRSVPASARQLPRPENHTPRLPLPNHRRTTRRLV